MHAKMLKADKMAFYVLNKEKEKEMNMALPESKEPPARMCLSRKKKNRLYSFKQPLKVHRNYLRKRVDRSNDA